MKIDDLVCPYCAVDLGLEDDIFDYHSSIVMNCCNCKKSIVVTEHKTTWYEVQKN